MDTIKISEIFYSIQGESNTSGFPTVFVRLTGCPIRCSYCDTAYAFSGGADLSIEQILERIQSYKSKYVLITGGEPLAQINALKLIKILCDNDYYVSIETGGMLDISSIDSRANIILDIKTPGSNESHNNLVNNYSKLKKNDQIKFVICDFDDFSWARAVIEQYSLLEKCEVIFSPSYGEVDNNELANWVLDAQIPIRFQVQLHKILWGDVRGK
ncbi:MAG: 7-carboxy-7-deazaguanine synthase QueE [Legionellales bacterium]|nr:7-carboxy-7-deazaguanine synthase QueE [Legionellales bacterium]